MIKRKAKIVRCLTVYLRVGCPVVDRMSFWFSLVVLTVLTVVGVVEALKADVGVLPPLQSIEAPSITEPDDLDEGCQVGVDCVLKVNEDFTTTLVPVPGTDSTVPVDDVPLSVTVEPTSPPTQPSTSTTDTTVPPSTETTEGTLLLPPELTTETNECEQP